VKKVVRRMFRKRRSTAQEVAERKRKAAQDPEVLSMGVVELMKRYELNYHSASEVRHTVMSEKINSGNAGDLIAVNEEKEHRRLRSRVMRAESRFPLIHRRLISEKNMSAIARDFQITRERARQIKQQFLELRGNRTIRDLLDEIEEECGGNNGHGRRK